MAQFSNLYEYYQGLGQQLPSVQERAPIYEQQGLGAASSYQGTAAQNIALLGKLQTPIQPFSATVPDNITTTDAANSITAPPLPSDIQSGVAGTTPDPLKQQEASGVISDMAGSTTNNFQGRLSESTTYQTLQQQNADAIQQLLGVISKPDPVLDETQTKLQKQLLDAANKAYTDKLAELNKEELRIKGNWGVGPIWRGRLSLFNSEKALILEPLQIQQQLVSGQYTQALEQAQRMFSNAISLQQNKISKLSALNTMIQGQLSREEDNMWKQYQIDETNRLAQLEREQDLQDQKVSLAMAGYVFEPTATWDEITKIVGSRAATTRALEDAKLKDAKTEKNAIGQLMIDYPTAGINMSMTLEQAITTAQPFEAQRQVSGLDNTIFQTQTGETVDIGTTAGIKSLMITNPSWTYADFQSFMDKNTKLGATTIDNLLTMAGLTNIPATKLTRKNVSQLYGIPDDQEKTGFLSGIFGGKTNAKKLDEIMNNIKVYQDVGYTDDEILKLVKS